MKQTITCKQISKIWAVILCALLLGTASVLTACSTSSNGTSDSDNTSTSETANATDDTTGSAADSSSTATSRVSASTPEKNAIVARAEECIGIPYKWGGCGPEAVDASGLVSYCCTGQWTRIGTTETFMNWPRVTNPQPGDVCTSSTFCGIYIGNNTMIAASYSKNVVRTMPVLEDMIFVEYVG